MEEDIKASKVKTRGWVKALLAGSLAVNLSIVGLAVGVGANRMHGDGAPSVRDITMFTPHTRALPPDSRQRLAEKFHERKDTRRKNRDALRRDFAAFQEALRAVPYDEQAVVELLDRQRGRVDAQATAVRALFLEEVAAMTDAERDALADNMKRVIRRGPPRH